MNKIIFTILLSAFSILLPAQDTLDVNKMTKEDVMALSYDQLLEMPFEDVLKLADIMGVTMDELYEMLLNKDVVSASKKAESSFEAPLSTSVISYDEIIASGARTIEEALRLVPGVIVREKTNGNFDIHLRGNDNLPPKHLFLYSENSNTLVMIDGRPVYNYVHGGTFWETLPIGLSDIDRIEVVRGPSSALYGPNAVSGVVNIFTKTQTEPGFKADANVQYGSQGTSVNSFSIGKGLGEKFGFRASGNYETMDRAIDKLYVFQANNGKGAYLTREELSQLQAYSPADKATYNVFDPNDDVYAMYPNPERARHRVGGNAYLFFKPNQNLNLDLKTGMQKSDVLSSTMGDNPTSLAGRLSETGYVDFNASLYGLRAKVNVLNGYQDIVKQDTGFKVDLYNINSSLEYDINWKGINIRPGLSYQEGKYNDLPHLSKVGKGFLNRERKFSSTALSLRIDYLALEKLRLIGAIRTEKYNTHNDMYLSYQLIASYNLNDIHHIRLVHSRANRGPFLVDSYANFLWERTGRPIPGFIHFKGTKNLDLLTMNMVELGYRIKPLKNIQADFEFYYNTTNNYGALYPDSVSLLGYKGNPRPFVQMRYTNIDMKSTQLGLTGTVSWVINKNFVVKLFGTYQETKLTNVLPLSPNDVITDMLITAGVGNGTSTSFPSEREKVENKATPTFYGGFSANYTLKEKLMFNFSGNYLAEQEFINKNGTENIDPKLNLNLRIAYNIKKFLSVYVSGRNLMGKQREFGYMDEIGTAIIGGLTINY